MKKKKSNTKNYPDPQNFTQGYIFEVIRCLMTLDKELIEKVMDVLFISYKKDRKVFILGNGGSASTASHMACDISKGTVQRIYDTNEKRFQVISLTDNLALITALANDLTFDDVFIQQLRNLIKKDDILIVLSGSGNSTNIVKAVEYAKISGATTIGFLGFKTGGKLGKIVDYPIIVDSNHYGPIEDIHLILGHLIASWLAKVKNVYDGNKNLPSENEAIPFR